MVCGALIPILPQILNVEFEMRPLARVRRAASRSDRDSAAFRRDRKHEPVSLKCVNSALIVACGFTHAAGCADGISEGEIRLLLAQRGDAFPAFEIPLANAIGGAIANQEEM